MLAPLNIAHAACKGHAPENTLAGIRAALALGVDAIEIDVHATRDGVPVLMHDATVDRTTNGSGAVREMTLAEIRALDAGGDSFDGRFRGESVPALAEVLELTRRACLLVIEIKAGEIEREVAEIVRRLDAAGSAMVWSFRSEVVGAWRELMPEVPAAQLAGEATRDLSALLDGTVRRNAQAISMYGSSISPELVQAARLRGLTVYTWTVDEPEEQARVTAAGVDGIVTNVPDVLRATLESAGLRQAAAVAQPTA